MRVTIFLLLAIALFSCEKETVEPKLIDDIRITEEAKDSIILGDWTDTHNINNNNVSYNYTCIEYRNDTILNEVGNSAHFRANTEPYFVAYHNTLIKIPAFTDIKFNIEKDCAISINNTTFEGLIVLVDSTFEVVPVNDDLFTEYYTQLEGTQEINISFNESFMSGEFVLSLNFDGLGQAIELLKDR